MGHMTNLWIGVALVTLTPVEAAACSCFIPPPTPCPSLAPPAVVFVGTVMDIEKPPADHPTVSDTGLARYRFRVDEKFTGVKADEIDVYSGRGGADCSYHFKLGEQYLVAPYKQDGRLLATICSPTRPVAAALALLPQLRARRDGQRFANLFRILRRSQLPYDAVADDSYDRPLPNTAVRLQSDDHWLETTTDSDGAYAFYDVPPGSYSVDADVPSTFRIRSEERRVGKECRHRWAR